MGDKGYVVGIEDKLDCLIGLVNSMVELQSLILESQNFLLLSPVMRVAEIERYQNWLKKCEEFSQLLQVSPVYLVSMPRSKSISLFNVSIDKTMRFPHVMAQNSFSLVLLFSMR